MAGSPPDLRDPAVLALVRALHPDTERPAVRAPLEDLPSAPKITMTVLKKAACKMDVCSAAGPDGLPVLHVLGLMRSTIGDGGVDTGAKALLAFMQVCANGDLAPCVARCFGTAKHVSIIKNAASGVAGGLRPSVRSFEYLRLYSRSARRCRSQRTTCFRTKSPVAAAGTDIL
jgi:hypothetical protein